MRSGHFASSLFSFGAIQAVQILLPLCAFPWLGRKLGAEHFGLLMYMCLMPPVAALFMEWGITLGGSRLAASLRHDRPALSALLGTALSAKLLLASCCLLASAAFLPILPHAAAWPQAYFLAVGAGIARGSSPLWFCQGTGRDIGRLAKTDVSASIAALILVFSFINVPEKWWLYFLFLLICKGATYIWLNFSLWREYGCRIDLPAACAFLKKVSPLFATAFFPMLYNNGAQICIGFFLSAADMGIIVACNKMLRALAGAALPIGQTIYPEICIRNRDNIAGARRMLRWSLGCAIGLMLLACIPVWLFAPQIMNVALGPAYVSGANILRLMILAAPLMAANLILGQQTLVPFGHEKSMAAAQMATAFFSLPLAAFFSYSFGAAGAALVPPCVEGCLLCALALAILRHCPAAFLDSKQGEN